MENFEIYDKYDEYEEAVQVPDYDIMIENIKNLTIPRGINEISKMSIRKVKKTVILNSKLIFNNVNLEIPYLSEKDFLIYMWHGASRVKSAIREKNVFKIPLYYEEFATCHRLGTRLFNDSILPVLVDKLNITKIYPESTYVHELTHALVLRNKSSIENYLHDEVPAILLELIYTYINYGEEGLKKIQLYRLQNLNTAFKCSLPLNYSDVSIERLKYFHSSVLAFALFEKICFTNFKNGTEIYNTFIQFLNGKVLLEDLLEKYEISMENDGTHKSFNKVIDDFNQK